MSACIYVQGLHAYKSARDFYLGSYSYHVHCKCYIESSYTDQDINTVEPVLKDRLIGHKNVVS